MTIAERNNKLKHFITCLKCEVSGKPCDVNCPTQYEAGNMEEIIENLETISKALEQEPSGDLISRQAVLDLIADYDLSMGQVVKGIHALPSVNPQEPKTGHWIDTGDYPTGTYVNVECSCCHEYSLEKGDYCPNCGAKMVEPQESDEQEKVDDYRDRLDELEREEYYESKYGKEQE